MTFKFCDNIYTFAKFTTYIKSMWSCQDKKQSSLVLDILYYKTTLDTDLLVSEGGEYYS